MSGADARSFQASPEADRASSRPSASRPAGAIELSVIVPMYNEARRIGATLADLIPALAAGPLRSEVLLLDDGCTDATAEVVRPYLAPAGAVESVRLVSHERNRGKGAAVRTGLAASRGAWRLMTDADNSCRVDQVGKLLAEVERTGAAMAIGSRVAPGAAVEAKAFRSLAGGVFRLALWAMDMSLAQDTQCGFKLYRADFAELIVRNSVEDGFAFDIEHLALARLAGARVAEVGVEWKHCDGGTIHPIRDGLRMVARVAVIKARTRSLGAVVRGEFERPPAEAAPALSPVVTRAGGRAVAKSS